MASNFPWILGFGSKGVDPETIYNLFVQDPIGKIKKQVMDNAYQIGQQARQKALDAVYPQTAKKSNVTKGSYGTLKSSTDMDKVLTDKALANKYGSVANAHKVAQELAKDTKPGVMGAMNKNIASTINAIKANPIKAGAGAFFAPALTGAEAIMKWNTPGSDWDTRALDVLNILPSLGGTSLGLLTGHPILGNIVGAIDSNYNANRIQDVRNMRNNYNINPLKDLTPEEQDIVDFYNETGINKKQLEKQTEEEDIPYDKITLNGQSYKVSKPDIPDRSELPPITSLLMAEQGTGQDGLGNNPYSGTNYQQPSNRLSQLELLSAIMGINPNNLGESNQQPIDDRDFYQRIYDRVDQMREDEANGKPVLRPPADTEEEQTKPLTANEAYMDRINQLGAMMGDIQNLKDSSMGWDAVRKANYAQSLGMTPYSIWRGDDQYSRLKTLYELAGKEYEIRKDIEDRARKEEAIRNITQKFGGDPMAEAMLRDNELGKTWLEKYYIPRANLPFENEKERQKFIYDSLKEFIKNSGEMDKEELKARYGIGKVDLKGMYDAMNTWNKLNTLSANVQYQEDNKRAMQNITNQLRADLGNQNSMTRLLLAEMKKEGTDTKGNDWATMSALINNGLVSEEQALAFLRRFAETHNINYMPGLEIKSSGQTTNTPAGTTKMDINFNPANYY